MDLLILYIYILILQCILSFSPDVRAHPSFTPKLFREYIGAEGKNVTFSDVPINSNVEFHFILSFAIDYTNTSIPFPTNGNFTAYWDTDNLTPAAVSQIKAQYPNVKVAMSLGGDTVGHDFPVNFTPISIDSWVKNAIDSVSKIVKEYNLDGIDIDYEHFAADPETFATCIGRLLHYLKNHKIVSFTSIAPFNEEAVQEHYQALWKTHGHFIDYINFQFYADDHGTTVSQFLQHFEAQSMNYEGGNIIVSFGTDNSGGLSPANGFFNASSILDSEGKLHGIFIWSADDSKKDNFSYEKQAQDLLFENNP